MKDELDRGQALGELQCGARTFMDTASEVICNAIRDRVLLEFDYDGLHRVVAPYCHGFTSKSEVLRGIQVGGQSNSRKTGFGKLWVLEKMTRIRCRGDAFVPDDPHYNPDDRAMVTIHCRVER